MDHYFFMARMIAICSCLLVLVTVAGDDKQGGVYILFPAMSSVQYDVEYSFVMNANRKNATCQSSAKIGVGRQNMPSDDLAVKLLSGNVSLLVDGNKIIEQAISNEQRTVSKLGRQPHSDVEDSNVRFTEFIPTQIQIVRGEREWTTKETYLGQTYILKHRFEKLREDLYRVSSKGSYDYKSNLERVHLGELSIEREIIVDTQHRIPNSMTYIIKAKKLDEFDLEHKLKFTQMETD